MSAQPMKVSRDQLLFTTCREAIVLVAYPDGDHHSIGVGSNDPGLKPGDTITVKGAFERLKLDMASRETIVNRALKVPVSQQIFDALTDLYYQNGNKLDINGNRGFDHIVSMINAGKTDEAAEYLPNICLNSKGQKIKGLVNRREMEKQVWLHADYGDLSRVKLFRGDPKTTPVEWYAVKPEDL